MKDIVFFKEKFIEQLTDTELIEDSTDFKTLSSWDSLTSMAVINMIEDEFGVNLSDDDLTHYTTIQELYNLIKSKA
jgi:acyl carrier protein